MLETLRWFGDMKKKIITLIVCGGLLLCGCGSTSDKADIGEAGINCADLVSVDDKDAEAWMATVGHVCSTEDGAYIAQSTDDGTFLFYYEYDSGKYTKVCNKPECSHNDESCIAYLNGFEDDEECYDTSTIQKYGDAIYMSGLDNKTACIYKVNCDGSQKEKVVDLFDAEVNVSKDGGATFSDYTSFEFCIHRGYVYYCIRNGQNSSLYRKKLDGSSKSEETIVSIDEQNHVYRLEPYGRYVFFQRGQFNENYSDLTSALYAYDTKENKTIKVKDDIITVYMIKGDMLYYEVVGEGIHEYSLVDGSDKLVVSSDEAYYMIYKTSNAYIAVCFDGIRAYDEEGSLIYKAGRDVCVELSYVNDNYLVMWTANDDGESQYTFINNVQDNPDNWNSNTVVFQ